MLKLSILIFLVLSAFSQAFEVKVENRIFKFKEVCGKRILADEVLPLFNLNLFFNKNTNKYLLESKNLKENKVKVLMAPELNSIILNGKPIEFGEVPLKICDKNKVTFTDTLIKQIGGDLAYPKSFSSEGVGVITSEKQITAEHELVKEVLNTEFNYDEKKQAKEMLDIKTIVIDPGHGGEELGTTFNKTNEKDITLAYAEELSNILKSEHRLNVILTRTKDETLSLDKRSEIANSNKADLFISLHVNSAPSPKNRGFETFILNVNATDDDARKIALTENSSLIKEEKKQNATLADILLNLEQNIYLQESANLASKIHNNLLKSMPKENIINRGVKQAMFFVLSHVAMPAVLVEVGFLSNEKDRAQMLDEKFRHKFVRELAKGIIEYKTQVILRGKAKNDKTNEQKRK